MWASGYEPGMLSGLPSLLRQGDLAVEVFVIISAFVIFLLLDTKRIWRSVRSSCAGSSACFPVHRALHHRDPDLQGEPLERDARRRLLDPAAHRSPGVADRIVVAEPSVACAAAPCDAARRRSGNDCSRTRRALSSTPRGAFLSSGSSTWWRPGLRSSGQRPTAPPDRSLPGLRADAFWPPSSCSRP